MRTVELKLYKYSELSETAKQKVKDNWGYDDFWWSERNKSYEEAKKLYDILDNLSDEVPDMRGVRLYKYIQNNILPKLRKRIKYVKDSTDRGYHKYASSKVYEKEVCRFSNIQFDEEPENLTGYCADYDFLKPIFDFLKNPNSGIDVSDLASTDLKRIWEKLAQDDYDQFYEEEHFADHMESNNYEFLETGKRY